ncbi:MAG: hypothetical protein O3A01_02635 [bacterium]|nr:hypothetical protein [bacterium]
MEKRFHLAIGVRDIARTVDDYTARLGASPIVHIPGEYALFKTDALNISLRRVAGDKTGLRHMGWESDAFFGFNSEIDTNGYEWEYFDAIAQKKEILAVWPHADVSKL